MEYMTVYRKLLSIAAAALVLGSLSACRTAPAEEPKPEPENEVSMIQTLTTPHGKMQYFRFGNPEGKPYVILPGLSLFFPDTAYCIWYDSFDGEEDLFWMNVPLSADVNLSVTSDCSLIMDPWRLLHVPFHRVSRMLSALKESLVFSAGSHESRANAARMIERIRFIYVSLINNDGAVSIKDCAVNV